MGRMRRTRAASILLLALALGAVCFGAQADKDPKYLEAAAQLTCQCGCREQLTVCAMQNCHSATPMRAEIRQQLAEGKSVEEIVSGFVARMGKVVLAAPTTRGFDLAAWVMPFLLLALGLVFVVMVVRRMARPVPAGAPGGAAAIDSRIEEELRDFEEES